ncbi:MAG: VanZ family protein [Fermentimonas sp.]|nr:VanZ family protein [Fermentimonas sp.]MDD4008597.1 VanZ family protein [Fermentimonas sp.]MDD4696274.1 VanZ family protein [Fermentimonas sp.]
MNILLRYTLLPLIIGLLIFIGTCLIPSDQVPEMPAGIPWDKIVHFGMFFLLSAVSLYDYYKFHNNNPRLIRWLFWGFLVPVIYGGIIELLQMNFFSSRSAELVDWIADVLGSLVATILAIIFLRRRR